MMTMTNKHNKVSTTSIDTRNLMAHHTAKGGHTSSHATFQSYCTSIQFLLTHYFGPSHRVSRRYVILKTTMSAQRYHCQICTSDSTSKGSYALRFGIAKIETVVVRKWGKWWRSLSLLPNSYTYRSPLRDYVSRIWPAPTP